MIYYYVEGVLRAKWRMGRRLYIRTEVHGSADSFMIRPCPSSFYVPVSCRIWDGGGHVYDSMHVRTRTNRVSKKNGSELIVLASVGKMSSVWRRSIGMLQHEAGVRGEIVNYQRFPFVYVDQMAAVRRLCLFQYQETNMLYCRFRMYRVTTDGEGLL